jgi:hypothetical protein
MAKTLELAFQLAGKIQSSFTAATQAATGQLTGVHKAAEKVSAAAQKRYDTKALKDLSKAAENAGKAFRGFGSEMYKASRDIAVLVAAGAGIYRGIMASADYADQAIKNAQSVGMSTAAFTEMAYAAEMAGVSQQDFVSGSAKLSKSVESALGGNQQMIDSFARAGISSEELAASLGEPEKLYAKLADTFASMPDGIGKTSLSMALLGKSGSKFIPFLNAGSAAMEQMREDARRLGISLSETDAKNAEAFNDSFANIGKALRGVSLIIGKELWPHLTKVHESITKCITANGQLIAQNLPGWIEQFKQKWPEIESGIKAVCKGVRTAAVAINDMVQGMGGWIPLVKRLVQAWTVYRGLRIGMALYGAAAGVVKMGKAFIVALPAMARWIGAKKEAVKSTLAFGKNIGSFLKNGAIGLYSYAKTWAGTFAMIKDGLAMTARGMIRSAAPAFASIKAGLISAAAAAGKFAAAMAAKGAAAVGAFASSLSAGIMSALSALGAGLAAAATAAYGFAAAILANPITWIIAGIVALGAAVYLCIKYWDEITAAMSAAWDWIKDVFVAGWNALPGWIQEPLESLVDYIKNFDIVSAATNLMTRFGEGLLAAWNSIKSGIASAVTEWIPGGETLVNMASSGASMVKSGVGAVADTASGAYNYMASLSPFAEGGVVTSPQAALIGEAGPEVVIPVSRPNRARELMSTAADMMGLGSGGAGGGNTEYHITFSPKITISGNGESVAEQVRQSMFQAKEDLRRMLQELAFEHSRMAMR